jgi:CRISPR type III-B/RAMP module RAMP protein Cmr6
MAMEKAQSEGSGQEAAGHAWLYRHMQEWLIEGWRSTPYATSRGYSKRDDSGIANPLENGFAFHHSLGVPYLAATGLKGALRAYWEQWHSAEGKEQFTGRLFGKNGVAGVAFFDMLPTTPPTLGPEVMTPHYGDWYAASGADIAANAPGDWMSPIPIPFLAVETGATFQIAVAPRTAGDPDWPRHLQCMRDVLGDALSVVGLGAKTAVGYGRFKLSDGRRETAPSPGAPKAHPRAGQGSYLPGGPDAARRNAALVA